MIEPRFIEVADHAVLVEFGTAISDSVNHAVQAFDRAIAQSPPTGLCEVIPAFVNLLVVFDPLVSDHQSIITALKPLVNTSPDQVSDSHFRVVEVCYDTEFAPDLEAVAQTTGLTVSDVVDAHMHGDYRVGMYGFAPGYAYLAGTPPAIQVPRKNAAVRDVPKGSVIIAGAQCLVTTLTIPTGWSVIGRSPTPILNTESERPFLFDIGDQIQFKRITRQRFDASANENRHE